MSMLLLIGGPLIVLAGLAFLAIWISMLFRRVVLTNTVHVVQSRRKTTSYGAGGEKGNVYYEWPAFLPFIGVTVIRLPVNNFDCSLHQYKAYDAATGLASGAEMISATGGQKMAGLLAGLAQTEEGAAIVNRLAGGKPNGARP